MLMKKTKRKFQVNSQHDRQTDPLHVHTHVHVHTHIYISSPSVNCRRSLSNSHSLIWSVMVGGNTGVWRAKRMGEASQSEHWRWDTGHMDIDTGQPLITVISSVWKEGGREKQGQLHT